MWPNWGLLLALAGQTAAVFRDDAGYIDGKDVYLGHPLAVSEYNSSLAVSGDSGIITVLNNHGNLFWRKVLSDDQLDSGIGFYDDLVVVGGDYLSGINATDGTLLWTVNYPTRDITATKDGVVVDGKLIVTASGDLISAEGKEVSHYKPLKESKVNLENGTLSWDKFGVLSYTTKDGEVQYTRNDGLAHVKQAIFVNPPITAREELDENVLLFVENDDKDVMSILASISSRLKRHGSQIYGLCKFILLQGPAMLVLPEPPKESFGFNQLLVVLTEAGSVYGLNATEFGRVAWVYHDLDAQELYQDVNDSSKFTVVSVNGEKYAMTYDGEFANSDIKESGGETSPNEQLEINGAEVSSPLGWSVKLPGTKIVGSAYRDPQDHSASLAVPADANGDILYKYLNPYAVALASYSEESKHLVVTILNSVTGRIITQMTHAEPVVVNQEWPFNIAYGEHWVVYTYLSTDASQAPKIAVIELYESSTPNERLSPPSLNAYNDTLAPFARSRSWILPSHQEPVYSLALSKSRYGANAREIILALEHQIITLPKLLLSAILPTSPLLKVPQSSHLSHAFGVSRAQKIVTAPTNLESTYVVAALGGPDLFLSRASPAGEFDMLNKKFPKVKLILFLALLGFVVFTLAPFARLKKLKAQWR